jgi:glycosyltransferase involved in cell wall biosynthesis
LRVAIAHDWLNGMRGGERVLEALLELYPSAELYTLFHDPGSVSKQIESRPIRASVLDRLPGGRRYYRHLLPLYPWAVARFDLTEFDLVISSSHCAAKGVRVPQRTPHICYCHTPMRYLWDQYDAYFAKGRASLPTRLAMSLVVGPLRRWDARSALDVDHFVANSRHIQDRIKRCYGRESNVVHPPVDLERFSPGPEPRADFYLTLGALVPYKRLDLAVAAFNRLGQPLRIVGAGVERERLRAMAGPNVTIEGPVSDEEVVSLLARCRALILPGVEDFGIGVVEALASGAPVIALGEGGALDTVREAGNGTDPSMAHGVFFSEQTVEALLQAVERFQRLDFDPAAVTASASDFPRSRFMQGMRLEIDRMHDAWPGRLDGTARPSRLAP